MHPVGRTLAERGRANLERALSPTTLDAARVTSLVETPQAVGSRVQAAAMRRGPELELLGLDRILATLTAEVRDGKLTLFRSDPDQLGAESPWWLQHGASAQSATPCDEPDSCR